MVGIDNLQREYQVLAVAHPLNLRCIFQLLALSEAIA